MPNWHKGVIPVKALPLIKSKARKEDGLFKLELSLQ